MSDVGPTPLGTFPSGLQTEAAQLNPYEWFGHCRDAGPVVHDQTRGCYDVFDYEGVTQVLGDHERFSSDPRTHPNNLEDDLTAISRSILYQDPPRHDELRSIVDDFFTPGAIKELTPNIEAVAEDLLDDVIDEAGTATGRFDLVHSFAYPFPVMVIAGLLGVPPEDHDRFRSWSTTIVASSQPGDDQQQAGPQAYAEMEAYFQELLDERRANPRADLLSRLVQTGDLSDDEVFGFAVLLLAAGNLTTTNFITNAVWSFHEAGCTDAIHAGDVDLELALEEVLRYRSPVQGLQRWTTTDISFKGHDIPAGTSVVAWINAANRDPAMFDDAESFVPERRPNRHVAFGQGIHICLGASLARLEGRIALEVLTNRFERLEPVLADMQPLGSVMIYGPRTFPVRHELR